jgi:hypothetical protein
MGRILTHKRNCRLASMPEALLALLSLILLAAPVAAEEDEAGGAVEAVAEDTAEAGASGEEVPDTPPAENDQPQPDATTDDASGLKWDVEGYLSQEWRYRNAGGSNDLDIYTHVFADVTFNGDRVWKARVNGRLVADVAGDQDATDPLRDIWDGFQHDVQFRLYEAYAETDSLFDMLGFRGGRQFIDEGVYLHYDGVRLDLDLNRKLRDFTASIFGGVPVKFGEPNREESWLVGVVVRGKVAERTRIRLEYYHVSEYFEGINDPLVDPLQQPQSIPAQNLDDDLLGLSVWHRFEDTLRAFVRFSLLNGEANELQARLRWFTLDGKWAVVLDTYTLFERLLNVTNDLTPFVPMLGSFEPFFRVSARITYRHGDTWIFQGGVSYRVLADEDDEGTFNHEYEHYYLAITRLGLLEDERLDLTVTANGFYGTGNDAVNVSGHLDFRLSEKITLSGGIDYALYKYDFFQNTEHEDVWTYAARLRWQVREKIRVTGEFSVDDDRFYTYYTFLLKVTVRF